MALGGVGSLALSCSLLVDLDGLRGGGTDASIDAPRDAVADAGVDVDADAVADAPPDAPPPCDPTKAFDAPLAVSGLDGNGREDLARFSSDLLTAYVLLRTPSVNGVTVELLQYERPTLSGTFKATLSLGIPASALGTVMGQGHFGISESELDLVYVDAVDKSAVECTRAARTIPFGNCAKLPDPMSSPFLLGDGSALYGVGAPGGQLPGPALATRASNVWSAPVRITELDTFGAPTTYTHPVASPDERTLYFAVGAPSPHVMRATRAKTGQPFGAPTAITELEVNGTFTAPTWLSTDQCNIFLVTDRTGTTDIFTAKRPK